jgi:hypothetical protein
MLGISLDSNDTAIAKSRDCICGQVSKCNLVDCECIDYCFEYKNLYSKMKSQLSKLCFLTFSPKPKGEAALEFGSSLCYNERNEFKSFVKRYLKNNNIEDFIAVTELTNKGQIHYHVMLTFKSKVTFIKQVIQPLYYKGNVLPVYNAGPKEGIHYLFKAQLLMTEYHGKKTIMISS